VRLERGADEEEVNDMAEENEEVETELDKDGSRKRRKADEEGNPCLTTSRAL
jgi:hypothetical protein